MFNKEESELANAILFALMRIEGGMDALTIYETIDNPFKTYAHFMEFIEEMDENASRHVDIQNYNGGTILSSNEFTEEFLDDGGFVTLHEETVAANRNQLEEAIKEKEHQKLVRENVRLTNELNKTKLKTHFMPIIISAISALIAIGSLIYSINKPVNNVHQEQIETLKVKLERLQNGLEQQNDKLKDDLHKAEMLISIYEADGH